MKNRMIRLLAGTLLSLAIATLSPVQAQDAGSVLRLSVGFRTMKNSVQMDDAKRKEVEALEAQARAATGSQKFGEAVKHYSHAIALMRNHAWTPSQAMSAALQVKADRLILDPGAAIKLTLSQWFALDQPIAGKLSGSLEIKNNRQGLSRELKSLAELEADFTKPFVIEAVLPGLPPQADLADGDYQLALTLKPREGDPLVKSLSVRVARGLSAEAASLKSRTASVAATLKDQPALLTAMPAIEYAASMIDLVNAGEIAVTSDVKGAITHANTALNQLAKGQHPLKTRRGDIHWAYRSTVDNTLQPYRVFVPADYEPTRKWPLVVALHGMGGDENSFFNGYDNGVIKRIAQERGYLVVCPKGRQPASMYLAAAEKDVIDVLAEVKRDYAIDADRVYLTGHSMGGYGTWSVSTNHPDLFAALAPFAGGGLPPVMMKLPAIKHIPWIVVHGDADPTVSVEESRKMVKAGKELGIKIKYIEVAGGNHSNIVVPNIPAIFDWFEMHKRLPAPAVKAAGSGQEK
jgi:predicted esterase